MIIVGIDEVGRGCWAGPLVAGAVILQKPISGLTDSKLLSKKTRDQLSAIIKNEALAIGLGWVDANVIDKVGLTEAVRIAMSDALAQIKIAYDRIIIDGDYNYLHLNDKAETLIKADLIEPSVSAASILAKVARDTYMETVARIYPEYGFENHVGYGTKQHSDNLKLYGVSNIQRKSFKPVRALL